MRRATQAVGIQPKLRSLVRQSLVALKVQRGSFDSSTSVAVQVAATNALRSIFFIGHFVKFLVSIGQLAVRGVNRTVAIVKLRTRSASGRFATLLTYCEPPNIRITAGMNEATRFQATRPLNASLAPPPPTRFRHGSYAPSLRGCDSIHHLVYIENIVIK